MAFEQKEGSGALFKNAKQKPTQPDYRGDCKIGGKNYSLSAWIKEGAKGKWMSISIQEPRDKKEPETPF